MTGSDLTKQAPEKNVLVISDKNGIQTDHSININDLKKVGDILKTLTINEETALLFYKNKPIPNDCPISEIGAENIKDYDFQILKVIFDE